MISFTALADPTRRSIVEMLAKGERPVGDIARKFDVSAPAISQHLKILKEAGLVSVRVDAQRRIYQLDPSGFSELTDWVDAIRQFWNPRLDALERALKEDGKKKSKLKRRKKR